MLNKETVEDNLACLYPSHYDTLIVQAVNGLQQITDPRLRFNTLALLFVMTCRTLELDQKRVLELTNSSVRDAEEHNTAEVRGISNYIRNEY